MSSDADAVAVADRPKRGLTRSERKIANEAIRDAAAAFGMRRRPFMREVDAGNPAATEELENSLAMADVGWEWDPERFKEFLNMILEFIRALLAIFGGI